eukprot:10902771-Alexandrium_andersonii.AAC.1
MHSSNPVSDSTARFGLARERSTLSNGPGWSWRACSPRGGGCLPRMRRLAWRTPSCNAMGTSMLRQGLSTP